MERDKKRGGGERGRKLAVSIYEWSIPCKDVGGLPVSFPRGSRDRGGRFKGYIELIRGLVVAQGQENQ